MARPATPEAAIKLFRRVLTFSRIDSVFAIRVNPDKSSILYFWQVAARVGMNLMIAVLVNVIVEVINIAHMRTSFL